MAQEIRGERRGAGRVDDLVLQGKCGVVLQTGTGEGVLQRKRGGGLGVLQAGRRVGVLQNRLFGDGVWGGSRRFGVEGG